MKNLFKYLGYFVSFIIVALIAVIIGGYLYFKSGLPDYDGTVELAGLKDKVSITRDENALPHIIAKTAPDAYFAIGYAHAQDRLWQMHLHRHIAQGRLSELVGAQGLNTDKFLRNLGIFNAAQAAYPLLSQQTRTEIEAYSAGVNAYLAEDHILPVEFTILQLDKPEPWQPVHTAAWMKIMAWDLNGTWRKEINRFKLSANFTPAQIAELHPAYPGDKTFIPPTPEELYGFKLAQSNSTTDEIKISKIIDNQTTQGIGSNNWVLSGKLSQTGMPLLANDPHLQLTAPALWYHAHLKAEDGSLNAIGSTMPAVPFIILGRNDKIAWGFTNTDPDAQDLYVEKITKEGYYKTPTGEEPFILREEIIKVKGGEDVKLTTRATRHGPVLSDQIEDIRALLGKNHVIAMRWTALDADSRGLDTAANLAKVQNWQQLTETAKHHKAPIQSIVYADVEGNIGFIAPGAIPVRHPDNELYGQYPSPGWDAKYDWQGYIPSNEVPQSYNPEKGYVATANHKIVDEDYPHHVASKWSLPYRFDRITQLIEDKPKHTLETLKIIQLDQYSIFLENIRPLLDKAITMSPVEDATANKAYSLIKNWDGRATVESREMLIITVWIQNLQRAILAPEFDETFGTHHLFLEQVLSDTDGMSRWCGDIHNQHGTPQSCADLVAETLSQTTAQLSERLSTNMDDWQWGKVHQAVGAHRIFDKVSPLNQLFNLVVPIGGGKTTVNVASYGTSDSDDFKQVFKNTHGPSLRHLFDLSDLEKSRYIHSSGQSGNVFSPYYGDYLPKWAAGEFIPMVMDEVNYKPNSMGTLILMPKDQ